MATKKSYFRTTPSWGQRGYNAAYGYVSWNGKPEDGTDVESVARDHAKTDRVPEGEPTELYVKSFLNYINEH